MRPEIIHTYFPDLTDKQKSQLTAIGPLYADWNGKINVISRKDIENFYVHHVLHSASIAKVVQFVPGTRVLDIGTGGGFPGVPLAILFPEANFVLVDSIGKKLKVIDDIASHIGLHNIKTVHDRAENIQGPFDFVTSRAVTKLDVAWGWVAGKISGEQKNSLQNGMLYLKGGDIDEETPIGVEVRRFELSEYLDLPYFDEKSLIHIYK